MEPDTIVGITVLAELEPGQFWLFICCVSPDRKHIDQTAIRAVEEGKAHKHEAGRPVWTYKFISDCLIEVKPSVWWKYQTQDSKPEQTYFHNGTPWTTDVCCENSPTAGETADRLNAELRQQWRDKWIKHI